MLRHILIRRYPNYKLRVRVRRHIFIRKIFCKQKIMAANVFGEGVNYYFFSIHVKFAFLNYILLLNSFGVQKYLCLK